MLGLPALCTALVFLGAYILWKGFFPVFPTCLSFVALSRGLCKTQGIYLGLGDHFFFPVVSFGT